jgi:hypothetical protein
LKVGAISTPLTTSNVNLSTGQTIPNLVVAPVANGTTEVIVDQGGCFMAGA